MRTKPGVSEDSIKLEPLLREGVAAFVLDGPVLASGYDWYLLYVFPSPDLDPNPTPPELGWVAAADKTGEPWLGAMEVQCPDPDPVAGEIEEFEYPPSNLVRLSCFGGQELTFNARLAEWGVLCGVEPPWRTEPVLFDFCYSAVAHFLAGMTGDRFDEAKTFQPVFDGSAHVTSFPEPLVEPHDWAPVRVTGQFDHPLARSCHPEPGYEDPSLGDPPPVELVVMGCRSQFVVSALEPLDQP